MAMTGDDYLLPTRSVGALREEVAGRVARRRRQRARQRAARIGLPLAAAAAAFFIALDGAPRVGTDVDTVGPAGGPAADVTSVATGDSPSARRSAERRVAGLVAESPSKEPNGGVAALDPSSPSPGSPPSPSSPSSASPTSGAGSPPRGATTGAVLVRFAVARPDGIWELGADGSARRRLVEAGRDPAWSPDGRRLAYTKRWDGLGGGEGVAVLDLGTMESRVVLVPSDADYVAPTWSPDGTSLAVSKIDRTLSSPPDLQHSVVVVDAADGSRRFEFGPGEQPSWLADGRMLYRCANRLCVRSTNGTTAEVPQSQGVLAGAWSPDGSWIAAWEMDSHALVLLRPGGGERRTVVPHITGIPAWTPDGGRLVYPSSGGLRSARLDGTDVRTLTDQPHDTDPDLVGVRP